ncbi:hypothetical protein [Deinococcus sp. Arct2-2]|uniref:hypothetical protein n=1 Tax=Deinococcus sp. Arct2-2 TaxID=2568653 RepID=UPI00197A81A3|nr:hypothetical protein [Deinococcus sp. Arct2-2]
MNAPHEPGKITALPKRTGARRNEQTLLDIAALFVTSGVEVELADFRAGRSVRRLAAAHG